MTGPQAVKVILAWVATTVISVALCIGFLFFFLPWLFSGNGPLMHICEFIGQHPAVLIFNLAFAVAGFGIGTAVGHRLAHEKYPFEESKQDIVRANDWAKD